MENKTIVIKPGLTDLIIGMIWIINGVAFFVGLGEAIPTDNPKADEMARWVILFVFLILGLCFILFFSLKRIKLDDKGIVINKFPFKKVRYEWNEISHAKIIDEALAYSCVVYSGKKKILKIPRAYKGYEWLLYELDNRKIIEKDNLYLKAKAILEIDKREIKY